MAYNPVNLGLRFLLELFALAALGYRGWSFGGGIAVQIVLMLSFPIIAATIWGVFNVRNDSSRSGKAPVPVPGVVRLLIEVAMFGTAVWGLFDAGATLTGAVLGGLVLIHYALSYNRLVWLVRQ
jgi:hypothetical protein